MLKIKSQCSNSKSDGSIKMCKVCGSDHHLTHKMEEKPGVLARSQIGNLSKSRLDS